MPSGTRANIFEDYVIGNCLFAAVETIVEFINRFCKFRVLVWTKQGKAQDQGGDQPIIVYPRMRHL